MLAGAFWVSCGSGDATSGSDAADAPPVDGAADAPNDATEQTPTWLSDTGLYSDIGSGTIADGVREFRPRWELFSDDASKRRWIYLPPGATIDTSDMDFWSFPQGTKLWKEFSRDGTVIETRLLWKVGPNDDFDGWRMVSFQWNEGHTDAMAVPDGVVDDGGHNDIPGFNDCFQCHDPGRNPSVALGFSALQLDFEPSGGRLSLAELIADGRLSDPPASGQDAFFPLPSGDPVTETAFGYLHANCGGCHNARSSIGSTQLQLRLSVATESLAAWASTPTWEHTVGVPGLRGSTIVVPGDLNDSNLYQRVNSTMMGLRMPPLGRETIDAKGGVAAIAAWIESLAP